MLYKFVGGATLIIASLAVLTQIILLPLIFQYSVNVKNEFQNRIRKFHHNTRQFDDQLTRLRKLTLQFGGGGDATDRRYVRQLSEEGRGTGNCPAPVAGAPGPPGDAGEDGEAGDPGEDGPAGLDAYQLLLEEAQKCVECPPGPIGPIGAPGLQGFTGAKGEKGDPGVAGNDGIDGEQGPEGFSGQRGVAGKTGKRGADGAPAPGGQGPPGPPGVKGPPGSAGSQGERGKRNYVIGLPGPDGKPGKNGLDGVEGKSGPRGEKGEKGETGADARFCPCPSELNFNKQKAKPQSHLSHDAKAVAYSARSQPIQEKQNLGQERSTESPSPNAAPKPAEKSDEPQHMVGRQKMIEVRPIPVKNIKTAQFDSAQANNDQSPPNTTPTPPKTNSASVGLNSDSAVTVSNLAYEDAYPNYDGESRKSQNKPPQYDDDNPAQVDSSSGNGKSPVDGETSKPREEPNVEVHSTLHDGGDDENNSPNEEENAAAAITHRRFVYVTKRPRNGIISN